MRPKLCCHAAVLALLPACASAQARPDSVHRQNDCRLAIQVAETGTPAPHTRWAFERIAGCGREGGAALAAAIRRTRTTSDVAALDLVTGSARTLRDGVVFAAALDVAGDQTAATPARVLAFRTVIVSLSPGRVISYAQMAGNVERACAGLLPGTHDEIAEGTPLPTNASAAARAVAAQVAGNANEPAEILHAARCVSRYVRP